MQASIGREVRLIGSKGVFETDNPGWSVAKVGGSGRLPKLAERFYAYDKRSFPVALSRAAELSEPHPEPVIASST